MSNQERVTIPAKPQGICNTELVPDFWKGFILTSVSIAFPFLRNLTSALVLAI